MKKFVYLLLFLLISEVTFAQATTNIPQYTFEVKNFSFVTPNKLVFDLVFTHTDAIPLQLAGWQFFFRAPQTLGTFPAGTGSGSSFNLDSNAGVPASDLPEDFRPRNGNTVVAGNSPGNYEFRLASNSVPGAGNGLMIPQGIPILIGRFYMKSTTPIDFTVLFSNPFIIRDSCETPLSVTRTKLNFHNENSFGQEFTRCASHSVTINFGNQPPVPNFTSDRQTIFSGEGVNFTDASYNNPNSWLWTFPGGTPSSSNLQNPPIIIYNTPGIYVVTLQVSNPFGTNSITVPNYITVNSTINCPISWQSSIKATDVGNIKDSLKFGMSPQELIC
ncbi:MAG: PKD domain-containing protein [Ignavibacteria bacterium]|nr:PKD domain-containing protein [Ignavibacteria bacterium]